MPLKTGQEKPIEDFIFLLTWLTTRYAQLQGLWNFNEKSTDYEIKKSNFSSKLKYSASHRILKLHKKFTAFWRCKTILQSYGCHFCTYSSKLYEMEITSTEICSIFDTKLSCFKYTFFARLNDFRNKKKHF